MIIMIVALVLLVVLSGFFSGSEIVYIQVNKHRLQKAIIDGDKRAKVALELSQNYTPLLSTILAGNALANIAASSIATTLAIRLWSDDGILIATIGMTVIVLIFGEILPKTILSKYSFSVSRVNGRFLKMFQVFLFPIVWSCTKLVNLLSVIWTPKKSEDDDEDTTEAEMLNMVEEIEESGYINKDTSELIKSAIDFNDTPAYTIMTHRVDVIGYDIDDDLKELMENPQIFTYSRIVVYRENMDNIIGVLHTKTLLMKLLNEVEIDDITPLLIKPLYVHKTKLISELLKEFKISHSHFAIVVDEYGGTMGIVTLEDIIEDIVGDIFDETDIVEEDYRKIDDNLYFIDGEMNIDDLFEDLLDVDDLEFDKEFSTISGLASDELGKIPEVGETFTIRNFKFTITKMNDLRVDELKLEIIPVETDEDDD